MKNLKAFFLVLLVFISFTSFAQGDNSLSEEDIERFKGKAEELTNFYFYLLNTLADKQTGAREKEIIVTESYRKYFADEDVQVEDDLVLNREVPTNKDIDAYLKDVDFFFRDARFSYDIDDISQEVDEKGEPYIKVELTRRLEGVNVESDTLNNTLTRFIEFDIDKKNDNLKIASIYTTKLSQKEDRLNWWDQLSYGWKEVLKEHAGIYSDSITYEQLEGILNLKSVSLGKNLLLDDLDPVSKLTELDTLNISGSAITSLSPLRNLTKIRVLDISNTEISSLEPLRYAFALEELYADDTSIDTINVISNLKSIKVLSLNDTEVSILNPLNSVANLQVLNLQGTSVRSILPLKNIQSLIEIDIANTAIDSLPSFDTWRNLKAINLSGTNITNIEPVSSAPQLEVIRLDSTDINTLAPLEPLNSLKRIYSDYTGISRKDAAQFMENNPGTLVIFASDQLFNWWGNLNESWKSVLKQHVSFQKATPSKEELAALIRLDSLNLSSSEISKLEPLSIFHDIEYLDISDNNLKSLNILKEFSNIRHLSLEANPIDDISILANLIYIEEINLNDLDIDTLAPFMNKPNIRLIHAENTMINDEDARHFEDNNPSSMVIYKSDELRSWWDELDMTWQEIFKKNLGIRENPSELQLHQVIFLDKLMISDENISSLDPLHILLSAKGLFLEELPVGNFDVLTEFDSLRTLKASRMPINDLDPLSNLQNLRKLDVSDTPVKDLSPLMGLEKLNELNLSSTQVRSIKPLKYVSSLSILNISNTRVSWLSFIFNLPELKKLVVYNTKVNQRTIRRFKDRQPNCEVVYYR